MTLLVMKINIPHIAKLANLQIATDEEQKFEIQLSAVLEYITKLNEVDTTGVAETSQVTGLENVTRKDTTEPSLPQSLALSQAKSTHNNLFAVKGVFADE